jgi:arylsulfatase K
MSETKNVAGSYTEEEILKVRKTYYAMCAETDYLLSRVWTALTGRGYSLDNTYLVYLSDHGEMNMEHRQVWKNSMYEGSTRVPFQIAGPGVARGKRVEQLVSLLDVFPTLVDMARETDWARHSELAGKSVLPLALSSMHSVAPSKFLARVDEDRAVIAQYHSNMGNTGAFMVRKGAWKYITYGHTLSLYSPKVYHAQLFNVHEDPEEILDVSAGRPDLVAELDAELRSAFDPEDADRRAIKNDRSMYDRYFGSLSRVELEKRFKGKYFGFNETDWQKLQHWLKETSSLSDSVRSIVV